MTRSLAARLLFAVIVATLLFQLAPLMKLVPAGWFKANVTLELSVVTVLPYWSSTATCTAGAIVSAPSVLPG